MYFVSTWVAAVIARWRGKKVLMWTHGVRRVEKGIRKKLRLTFYQLADCLLLYGDSAKCHLLNMGIEHCNLKVIYNSLDYETMRIAWQRAITRPRKEIREELNIDVTDLAIIISGRLAISKGPGMLIKSIEHLRRQRDFPKGDFLGARTAPGGIEKIKQRHGSRGLLYFSRTLLRRGPLGGVFRCFRFVRRPREHRIDSDSFLNVRHTCDNPR